MDTKSASRHRKICTDKITGRATGKSSSLSSFRKSVTQIFEYFCWLSCFSPWHLGAKKCGISTCMLQYATHPHYPIMEAMGAQNGDQRRQSQIHWREGLQHDERMEGNPLHSPGSLMSSQRVQCSTSAPLLGEDIQCHHHLLWKRMNMEVRITGTDWEWQCQPHIRIFIPFIKQLMSFCIWIISINTPGMWRFPFLLRGWGFSSSLDMVPRVYKLLLLHLCAFLCQWGNFSTHIETEFYWKGSETSHFGGCDAKYNKNKHMGRFLIASCDVITRFAHHKVYLKLVGS